MLFGAKIKATHNINKKHSHGATLSFWNDDIIYTAYSVFFITTTFTLVCYGEFVFYVIKKPVEYYQAEYAITYL